MSIIMSHRHSNQQDNSATFLLLRHEGEHAYTQENCCFDRPDEYLHFPLGELGYCFVDAKGENAFFGNPTLFSFCSFFPNEILDYDNSIGGKINFV